MAVVRPSSNSRTPKSTLRGRPPLQPTPDPPGGMQEASLWEWEGKGQMPTQPARVAVPLRAITQARELHRAWRIGRAGRTLLLDVKFVWLAVLDAGSS